MCAHAQEKGRKEGRGTGVLNSSAPACSADRVTCFVYLAKKTWPRVSPTTSPVLPGMYQQRFPKPHLGTDGSVGWSPAADTVALLREEGCLDTGMNVMIQMT